MVRDGWVMRTILDFCRGLPERSFDAGETWIAEGAKTDILTILIDGTVEVLKGEVQVHVATEPGAVFGEISALLDIPHTATVRTLAPSRAHVVADAGRFLRSHPDLAYFLSKLMAQRLHGMTTYLEDLKRRAWRAARSGRIGRGSSLSRRRTPEQHRADGRFADDDRIDHRASAAAGTKTPTGSFQ